MPYPEPADLREYAQEPMPFHEIHPSHLSLDGSESPASPDLVAEKGPVTYRYAPEYITATYEDGSTTTFGPGEMFSHHQMYEWADLVTIEENAVSATGVYDDVYDSSFEFDAVWMLESVLIEPDD